MPDVPFLHGVETITSKTVSLVNTIKTAVIGLIGTSVPVSPTTHNQLCLCASENDDAQFGTTGTIPEALKIIRSITKKTGATVFVISAGTPTDTLVLTDIVGTYDTSSGDRTGLKLFDTCYSIYGFKPKIFIAPGLSYVSDVITGLLATANSFRGCAYLDAPVGLTVTAAIALRTGGIWAAASNRAKLLYPRLKDTDFHYFSIFAAANRAMIDATPWTAGGGFWVSSSNWPIVGITALETPITTSINDVTAETNTLNAKAITTCFNNNGQDFREWGNRNASFPANTDALTFECCQRAKDIVDESIELAMMPYIDQPIIQAFIDNVLQTVNQYFNSLIARGACIEGSKCTYDPAKNSTVELATGHIVFTNNYFFPTPGERITFDTIVDSSLLKILK